MLAKPLLFVCFISAVTFLTACQKEISTTTQESSPIRLTTVKEGDSLYYSRYIYDGQNRLIEIQDSTNNNNQFDTRSIRYDATGRLSSVTISSIGNPDQFYFFVYDNLGRIVRKLDSVSGAAKAMHLTYMYDEKGRLISDTIYSYWSGEVLQFHTYTYDNNDNVIQKKVYENVGGTFALETTATMQFDAKPNPYHALASVLYFVDAYGDDNGYSLNKNNCIAKTYQDGTRVTFSYQYNASGMPVKYSEQDNTDPLITYYEIFY